MDKIAIKRMLEGFGCEAVFIKDYETCYVYDFKPYFVYNSDLSPDMSMSTIIKNSKC